MIDKPLNKQIDMAADALEKTRGFVEHAHETQPARSWVGLAALIGAIIAGLLAVYLLRDFGKRNFEYMPDMAYSKAWESQTDHDYENDWGPGKESLTGDAYTPVLPEWMAEHGNADMPPPEGTRYRGQMTWAFTAKDQEAPEVVNARNPLNALEGAEHDEALNRGSKVFQHICQGCHGVDGIGNAPVTKYGIGAPAIDTANIRDKWTDGQLFNIITNGFNTMKPHATLVEYQDRWNVILYLRSLQEGK